MPRSAAPNPEYRSATLELVASCCVAEHGQPHRSVTEECERLEHHIGTFFVSHPAHPPDPEPLVRNPERSTGRSAVEEGDCTIPSVLNDMEAGVRHAVRRQCVTQRLRDRDD